MSAPAIGRTRRYRSVALIAAVVCLLSAPASPALGAAAPASATSMIAAEERVFSLLNRDRMALGLVPYRSDTRLTGIARDRARDMATHGYLSHVQPDGRTVFTMLTAQAITWYAAGEIIAWNTWPTPYDSATAVDRAWMASSPHRAIVVSSGSNYLGVGIAQAADGRFYWAAVTIRGPDRTGARAAMTRLQPTGDPPVSGAVPVALGWTGYDLPLQVLTSGFASYHVQRRVDGGAWQTVWAATTATSLVRYHEQGHTYEYRVRGRDRAANVGPWSTPLTLRV